MAVMARETWTDERMDDLVKQVDKGFDATKVEIRDLRAHTDKGFEEVKGEIRDLRAHTDKGFAEVKGEIRDLRAYTDKGLSEVKGEIRDLRTEMNLRFDAMQRTMILGFASIVASIAGSAIAAVVATQV